MAKPSAVFLCQPTSIGLGVARVTALSLGENFRTPFVTRKYILGGMDSTVPSVHIRANQQSEEVYTPCNSQN